MCVHVQCVFIKDIERLVKPFSFHCCTVPAKIPYCRYFLLNLQGRKTTTIVENTSEGGQSSLVQYCILPSDFTYILACTDMHSYAYKLTYVC